MRLAARISSTVAPVVLVAAWVWSATQAASYDPFRQTISELAALDQPTAGVMAAAFVLAGVCLLVTAWATTGIKGSARALLAASGIAVLAVAALPLPSIDAEPLNHRVAGVMAFILLATWPLAAIDESSDHWALRGWFLRTLALVNLAVTISFFASWFLALPYTGALERSAAVVGILVPTLLVHSLWQLDERPR